MDKILFIDTAHPYLSERLTELGFQCDYFDGYKLADYQKIADQYVGFVIRSKIHLDDKILPLAKKLKFVARVGAGMENIDMKLCDELGIKCLNAPEGNRDAVGEHAIAMLLSLFDRIIIVDDEVRRGIWLRAENRGVEIKGKTVGIIGYGNNGSKFAAKLSGFECRILAYDKYKTGFGNDYVEESDMDTIFREADIISFHVPLTEETRYLVNREYIARFQKPIYLINVARGPVVQTDALVEALENGKIFGACLDVLEYEKFSFEDIQADILPPSYRKLINMRNVVLSPHIAGWTHESNIRMAMVLIDKICALFNIKNE